MVEEEYRGRLGGVANRGHAERCSRARTSIAGIGDADLDLNSSGRRVTVLRAMDSGLHISRQNKLALVKKVGPRDEDSPDKEVALLKMWLAAERGVGKEQLKIIFERLFCCACNADKQPIQANLIGKPCSTIRR